MNYGIHPSIHYIASVLMTGSIQRITMRCDTIYSDVMQFSETGYSRVDSDSVFEARLSFVIEIFIL